MSLVNEDDLIKTKRPIRIGIYTVVVITHQYEHKRGVVKILMSRLDTKVNDERDNKVKENGYPEWLIKSIPAIKLLSRELLLPLVTTLASNDAQETEKETI